MERPMQRPTPEVLAHLHHNIIGFFGQVLHLHHILGRPGIIGCGSRRLVRGRPEPTEDVRRKIRTVVGHSALGESGRYCEDEEGSGQDQQNAGGSGCAHECPS
jgi:hypothetical protein